MIGREDGRGEPVGDDDMRSSGKGSSSSALRFRLLGGVVEKLTTSFSMGDQSMVRRLTGAILHETARSEIVGSRWMHPQRNVHLSIQSVCKHSFAAV